MMTHDKTRDEMLTEAQQRLDKFLVKYREKQLKEHAARMRVMEALVAAGVLRDKDLTVDVIHMGAKRVPLTVEQLPLVRKHLPQLKDTGAYEAEDPERNTVRVYLDHGVEGAKDILLFYVRELPPDGPCKFKDETRKAGTRKVLVCEKPEE